ncbi:MAG: hypothetical protein HY662_01605 [Chloroflexi bacterium]|nr:hypothetical protein [Chloroflexota bacterium]
MDKRKHVRGLIKLYLKHTPPSGRTSEVVHHRLVRRVKNLLGYERVLQPRLPVNLVYHTLNMDRLLFWYGAVKGTRNVQSPLPEKAVHHSIDIDRLLVRYGLVASNPVSPVCDTKGRSISHSLKQRLTDFDQPYQPMTPIPSVHHVMDIRRLQDGYSDTNRSLVTAGYYGWVQQIKPPEKTIGHVLNQARLLQRYQKEQSVPSPQPAFGMVSCN